MTITTRKKDNESCQKRDENLDFIKIEITLPKWIKRYFRSNRRLLTTLGILTGAICLTLAMQDPSHAQLFDKVESGSGTIGSYLPGLGDAITFLAEAFRLLLFGGLIVGAIGGAFSFISNRGWEVWAVIAAVMFILGGLGYAAETMVYGGGASGTIGTGGGTGGTVVVGPELPAD